MANGFFSVAGSWVAAAVAWDSSVMYAYNEKHYWYQQLLVLTTVLLCFIPILVAGYFKGLEDAMIEGGVLQAAADGFVSNLPKGALDKNNRIVKNRLNSEKQDTSGEGRPDTLVLFFEEVPETPADITMAWASAKDSAFMDAFSGLWFAGICRLTFTLLLEYVEIGEVLEEAAGNAAKSSSKGLSSEIVAELAEYMQRKFSKYTSDTIGIALVLLVLLSAAYVALDTIAK